MFGILFREADGAFAAVQTGADRNDFGDAGGLGADHDVGQILRVIGKVEMGVGVKKYGHGRWRLLMLHGIICFLGSN